MDHIYWDENDTIINRVLKVEDGLEFIVPMTSAFWQRYDELESEGWGMARYASLAWLDALESPISDEQRYEEYRRMMIQVVYKISDAQIGIEKGHQNDNRPDQSDLWARI